MSTVAKAFLLFLSTIIFLLFILFQQSPFCIYKIGYDEGYVSCVSVFKKPPHISSRDPDELSVSHNSFNDQKNNLPLNIDEKDVVKLSGKNFSQVIAENQHVMVAFSAPWCYWSKKLAPEYAAAATELKSKVVLAKVNAIKERELANKFKIQGYPTTYFFVNGVKVETYYSDRTRDAIVNWIKTRIAGAVYTVMTTEKADHLLTAKSTIALGFLDSLEGLENEELAAASKLHPDVLFYQTTSADVAGMFQIDPENKFPALVLLEKESKHLSHFDGPFSKSAIADFISVNKIHLMITYNRKNAPLIFNSPLKELWLFAATHEFETKSIFQEAAKAFKGKIFFVYAQTDGQSGRRQISDYFGITGHAPRVIAVTGILKRKKYVLNGELTISTIKSFAMDFLEDKLRNSQSNTTSLTVQFPLSNKMTTTKYGWLEKKNVVFCNFDLL